MKTTNVKKCISWIACIVIITSALLALVSCTTDEQNANADAVTRDIIDGVLSGDKDRVYEHFSTWEESGEFESFFSELSEYFEGVESYEIKQVGWHINYENGISTYTVVFEMVAEDDSTFMISSRFLTDGDSLNSFYVYPATTLSAKDAIPWQILLGLVSLLFVAFMIWMVVDCSKSNINKRGLWILLILVGVEVTLTTGAEFDFGWGIYIIDQISSIKANGVLMQLRLAFPVGSVIYFFMRKKLKADAAPPASDLIEADFTEVVEETDASDAISDVSEDKKND